jgi:hypothetical protein
MKEWLVLLTENAVVIIAAFALVIIVVGTIEAFARGLRLLFSPPSGEARRDVGLRYGHWLIA